MNIDVSVLIAAYKNPRFLSICLRSLLSQAFSGSWEVIICDDGSQPDILSLIQEVFPRHASPPELRYVWQPHSGERRGHSRNNGLRCARGNVIILIDADFAVAPDFVSKHFAAHGDKKNKTAVYGSRRWIFTKNIQESVSLDECLRQVMNDAEMVAKLYTDAGFQQKYAPTPYAWLGCMGCNFSFVRHTPIFFDEEFLGWGVEDQEFACRLKLRHGYDLRFEPSISGFHFNPGSTSDFCPVKPKEHSEILRYARNVLHFRASYSELDMTPACNGLGYFHFNSVTSRWERRQRPCFEPQHIHRLLKSFEAALKSDLDLYIA